MKLSIPFLVMAAAVCLPITLQAGQQCQIQNLSDGSFTLKVKGIAVNAATVDGDLTGVKLKAAGDAITIKAGGNYYLKFGSGNIAMKFVLEDSLGGTYSFSVMDDGKTFKVNLFDGPALSLNKRNASLVTINQARF